MSMHTNTRLVLAAVGALAVGYVTTGSFAADSLQEAEGFQWFWTFDGPVGADSGTEIVSDEEGNIFIAGTTDGLDFDHDGTADLKSDGAEILYIRMRETPQDDRVTIDWLKSPFSPGFNGGPRIAPDHRGGAYGIGRFQQYVEFEALTLMTAGLNDGFIARYGPDGNVVWAHVIGGPGQDAPMDVASDRAGNAYVVGWGEGRFPLDDRGVEFEGGDGQSGLIVSYDPEGNVRWHHAVPAPNRILFAVGVASDGQVFVTGELETAADFDGDGEIDLPASRDRDGFIARFDADGTLLGAFATPLPGRIAFLDDGDVILASPLGPQLEERYGPADFDRDGRADFQPKDGPSGSMAARYGRDGTLRWARPYALDIASDIQSDGERFAISGGYNGIRDLDEDGTPERVDHRSEQEQFNTEMGIIVMSGDDGRPQLAWTAPGPGKDHAASVLFMPDRRTLYVTGYLQYTADFTGDGVNGEGWVECESLGDFFFAQYRLPPAAPREVPSRVLTLTATRREISGTGWGVTLAWTGATSAEIDVYRDGERIATVPSDGGFTETVAFAEDPTYRVCEAGTSVCSNEDRSS